MVEENMNSLVDKDKSSQQVSAAWFIVACVALAGGVFTSIQIVERITILKNPTAELACNINSVLSCTNVLEAWQSSVIFGIPNALLGAIMFTIFLSSGVFTLLGGEISRKGLIFLTGLAIFFASFATWFMMQTAFVLNALCLWCTGITTSILIIAAIYTVLLAKTGGLGEFGRTLQRNGLIIIAYAGWWVTLAGLVYVGLML